MEERVRRGAGPRGGGGAGRDELGSGRADRKGIPCSLGRTAVPGEPGQGMDSGAAGGVAYLRDGDALRRRLAQGARVEPLALGGRGAGAARDLPGRGRDALTASRRGGATVRVEARSPGLRH